MVYDDRIQMVAGADYTYDAQASVNGADPLVEAWFTIKTDNGLADPGSLQKIVTTTNSPGTGQITDDGTTDGMATIRFDITATNTTALLPRFYLFDVKAKTASGAEFYCASGRLQVHRPTTLSA